LLLFGLFVLNESLFACRGEKVAKWVSREGRGSCMRRRTPNLYPALLLELLWRSSVFLGLPYWRRDIYSMADKRWVHRHARKTSGGLYALRSFDNSFCFASRIGLGFCIIMILNCHTGGLICQQFICTFTDPWIFESTG
jgi:hypothetical protein